MFRIVNKRELNSMVTLLEIEAPFVAKKAQAGQFIIFRVDEFSERVPLTIADYDREKGTVTIIFQKVGLSTKLLAAKEIGDTIQDFVGPLGVATEYDGMKKVAVVGGGVGCAIACGKLPCIRRLLAISFSSCFLIGTHLRVGLFSCNFSFLWKRNSKIFEIL